MRLPCLAGWNPIVLEEELEGEPGTPSADAADAADVEDVEIDASPTDLTLTLEAAECNEQHEEEVISDAGKWDAASLIPDLMWWTMRQGN